jgi:hypothetical protein
MDQEHRCADAIFTKGHFVIFEIIELLKEMLLKQINWFAGRVNQLFLYKAKSLIINMVEELTDQDQSLKDVIDCVKNLIAQLDEKNNCDVKKTAEPQVHSSSSRGAPNRQARQY